jgi:hypothetical protein
VCGFKGQVHEDGFIEMARGGKAPSILLSMFLFKMPYFDMQKMCFLLFSMNYPVFI